MKLLNLIASVLIYLFFLLTFSYLLVFLGGASLSAHVELPAFVKTIDQGPVYGAIPWVPAWLANALLVLAFGVQHSIMARSGFKALIKRVVPATLERSFFVLCSCSLLVWMYLAWQPMTGVLWNLHGSVGLLTAALYLAGAGLVLWATFLISHAQLFGIAQAWNHFRGQTAAEDAFTTPSLYKYSRHPMYLGMLFVFWSVPVMTHGHLLASVLFSVYLFIGIAFEERDLIKRFGQAYRLYQRAVPQVLPIRLRRA